MASIASSTSSYASFGDLVARFDLRPIEELLSDTGFPLSPQRAAVCSAMTAILQEASGVLEAAATAGQRYIITPGSPPTPAAPTLSTSATGGTVADGVYQVQVTISNVYGESLPSAATSVTTSGGNLSTITITSPATAYLATTWNAYITQVGGTTFTLQNTTATPIGTSFTLSAPPTTTGVNPPLTAVGQNDLWTIVNSGTNSSQLLIGIVAAIAYSFIWDRRPEWIGGDPEKAGFRVKMALEWLDKLANGQWVFGVLENMQAGMLQDEVESEQVLTDQRRITKIGRPLFGKRVSDYVGERLPPHPYP